MRELGLAGHEDGDDDWRLEGLVVVHTILVYMYVFCMYPICSRCTTPARPKQPYVTLSSTSGLQRQDPFGSTLRGRDDDARGITCHHTREDRSVDDEEVVGL